MSDREDKPTRWDDLLQKIKKLRRLGQTVERLRDDIKTLKIDLNSRETDLCNAGEAYEKARAELAALVDLDKPWRAEQ